MPYADGMAGFIDRRGDLREPRERWIERNAPEYRAGLWEFWNDLDTYFRERHREATEKAAEEAKSKGG